jgi:hypothetical protein
VIEDVECFGAQFKGAVVSDEEAALWERFASRSSMAGPEKMRRRTFPMVTIARG